MNNLLESNTNNSLYHSKQLVDASKVTSDSNYSVHKGEPNEHDNPSGLPPKLEVGETMCTVSFLVGDRLSIAMQYLVAAIECNEVGILDIKELHEKVEKISESMEAKHKFTEVDYLGFRRLLARLPDAKALAPVQIDALLVLFTVLKDFSLTKQLSETIREIQSVTGKAMESQSSQMPAWQKELCREVKSFQVDEIYAHLKLADVKANSMMNNLTKTETSHEPNSARIETITNKETEEKNRQHFLSKNIMDFSLLDKSTPSHFNFDSNPTSLKKMYQISSTSEKVSTLFSDVAIPKGPNLLTETKVPKAFPLGGFQQRTNWYSALEILDYIGIPLDVNIKYDDQGVKRAIIKVNIDASSPQVHEVRMQALLTKRNTFFFSMITFKKFLGFIDLGVSISPNYIQSFQDAHPHESLQKLLRADSSSLGRHGPRRLVVFTMSGRLELEECRTSSLKHISHFCIDYDELSTTDPTIDEQLEKLHSKLTDNCKTLLLTLEGRPNWHKIEKLMRLVNHLNLQEGSRVAVILLSGYRDLRVDLDTAHWIPQVPSNWFVSAIDDLRGSDYRWFFRALNKPLGSEVAKCSRIVRIVTERLRALSLDLQSTKMMRELSTKIVDHLCSINGKKYLSNKPLIKFVQERLQNDYFDCVQEVNAVLDDVLRDLEPDINKILKQLDSRFMFDIPKCCSLWSSDISKKAALQWKDHVLKNLLESDKSSDIGLLVSQIRLNSAESFTEKLVETSKSAEQQRSIKNRSIPLQKTRLHFINLLQNEEIIVSKESLRSERWQSIGNELKFACGVSLMEKFCVSNSHDYTLKQKIEIIQEAENLLKQTKEPSTLLLLQSSIFALINYRKITEDEVSPTGSPRSHTRPDSIDIQPLTAPAIKLTSSEIVVPVEPLKKTQSSNVEARNLTQLKIAEEARMLDIKRYAGTDQLEFDTELLNKSPQRKRLELQPIMDESKADKNANVVGSILESIHKYTTERNLRKTSSSTHLNDATAIEEALSSSANGSNESQLRDLSILCNSLDIVIKKLLNPSMQLDEYQKEQIRQFDLALSKRIKQYPICNRALLVSARIFDATRGDISLIKEAGLELLSSEDVSFFHRIFVKKNLLQSSSTAVVQYENCIKSINEVMFGGQAIEKHKKKEFAEGNNRLLEKILTACKSEGLEVLVSVKMIALHAAVVVSEWVQNGAIQKLEILSLEADKYQDLRSKLDGVLRLVLLAIRLATLVEKSEVNLFGTFSKFNEQFKIIFSYYFERYEHLELIVQRVLTFLASCCSGTASAERLISLLQKHAEDCINQKYEDVMRIELGGAETVENALVAQGLAPNSLTNTTSQEHEFFFRMFKMNLRDAERCRLYMLGNPSASNNVKLCEHLIALCKTFSQLNLVVELLLPLSKFQEELSKAIVQNKYSLEDCNKKSLKDLVSCGKSKQSKLKELELHEREAELEKAYEAVCGVWKSFMDLKSTDYKLMYLLKLLEDDKNKLSGCVEACKTRLEYILDPDRPLIYFLRAANPKVLIKEKNAETYKPMPTIIRQLCGEYARLISEIVPSQFMVQDNTEDEEPIFEYNFIGLKENQLLRVCEEDVNDLLQRVLVRPNPKNLFSIKLTDLAESELKELFGKYVPAVCPIYFTEYMQHSECARIFPEEVELEEPNIFTEIEGQNRYLFDDFQACRNTLGRRSKTELSEIDSHLEGYLKSNNGSCGRHPLQLEELLGVLGTSCKGNRRQSIALQIVCARSLRLQFEQQVFIGVFSKAFEPLEVQNLISMIRTSANNEERKSKLKIVEYHLDLLKCLYFTHSDDFLMPSTPLKEIGIREVHSCSKTVLSNDSFDFFLKLFGCDTIDLLESLTVKELIAAIKKCTKLLRYFLS